MFQQWLQFTGRREHDGENIRTFPAASLELKSATSLHVMMCRFNAGKLERSLMSAHDTVYLAVSHVWGEAYWQKEIPGVDFELLVSAEKAKFMAEKLKSIIGTQYFWMDILCVEQRDKAARIAVTQHIPTIFRLAQRTILIRDGGGIRDCCVRAMGDLDTWLRDKSPCRERLVHHHRTVHEGENIAEAVLSRLWVLQEVVLSDTIEFVRCDDVERRRDDDIHEVEFESLTTGLLTMSAAWAEYGKLTGSSQDRDHLDFARAFFNCGSISRIPIARHCPQFPTHLEFITQSWSTRRTGKPRDFILAVMPQYAFYTLPEDARTMTFAQLFVDCFNQLEAKCKESWLAPLIMGRFDAARGMFLVTDNIPSPTFLGDLVKYFLGPRLIVKGGPVLANQTRGHQVWVETPTNLSISNTIRYIQKSACDSTMLWTASRMGELEELSRGDSRYHWGMEERFGSAFQPEVIAILSAVSTRRSGDRQFRSLLENPATQSVDANVLLHTAALISCGLGLSAFEWSKRNLTPVFVNFRGKRLLALTSNSVLQDDNRHKFFLVEAERVRYWGSGTGKRFTLVSWNQKLEPDSCTMCLFPPDVDLVGWKIWRN
jgi:Heterokaryon incompatibility protein (HET)